MENNFEKLEKKIFNKLETEISINNFKNEEIAMNKKEKFSLLQKIITIIVSITAISGTVLFAYNKMKEVNYTEYGYSMTGQKNDSVREATENGYVEIIDTEYIYEKDIGCKVKSYFISDNVIGIQLDFDLSNKTLDKNRVLTKFIIYDENGNVYGKSSFIEPFVKGLKEKKYEKDFYKQHNLKEDEIMANSASYGALYESENHIIYRILLSNPNEIFPRNKKLFINVHDIGYSDIDTNAKYDFKSIVKDKIEWNFEINVSEKFYNRTSDEYKLKENIENFELKKVLVTDTQTTITYKSDNIDAVKGIVDKEGNLYKRYTSSFIEEQYFARCSFNKSMETTPLYLRIEVNGEIKDIELEKVNE